MTTRGNRGGAVFLDDRDRWLFLRELADVVERTGWRCLAYCLMTTHYHLLLQTPRRNLGAGMRRLNGNHASAVNRRHGLSGHVFGGRYFSVPAERDSQLLETLRYIALNPVRAGICSDPAGWRWSSHAAAAGVAPSPPWLDVQRVRGLFAGDGGDGRERYVRFVDDGLRLPRRRPARP